MDLRNNISERRRAGGLTQEDVASSLGVSRQTVGKWESGRAIPELEKLIALCDLLGCSLDELLEVFGIERSLSRKGNPYDNAAIESANKIFKRSIAYQRSYATLEQLRSSLNEWVWYYNNERMHSTLDYLSPVEFRQAGLTL